jgi:hypothetical protein
MGGVVDSVGDVLGGAADFVGDVVGGVGDFVGDVASNIDIEDAVKAYVMSGGNPYAAAFAATDFDEELGFNPASFYDPVSGGFSFAPGNVPGGGGYQGGFIKTGIDSLDQALSVAKSGYDLYNLYDQKQQPTQQPIPSLSYQQTSSGTQVDPNAFGQGLQYSFIAGLPELGDITDIITKSVSGLGNILMNAFGSDNLAAVIKKYGPAVLSVIGGKLSYDDQKRINDIVMGVYNKYNVGTELKKLQYRTGEGLASLPVFRSTKQLGSQTMATAPQRTAADVVVRPKAQMGGIMQLGAEQDQSIFPRLESLSQNLGQAEQTLGQPSNQSNMSSITTAITGQQPQGFAEGGSPEEEMELKNEFNYNRRRNEMEDLLDEYQRFKMRKDYQKRYPRDEARNGGRMGYADGSPAAGLAIKLNRPVQSGDPVGSYYDRPGQLIDRTQPVERKMGLMFNPDGSYPGENMPNPIQALPRPGMPTTQIQSNQNIPPAMLTNQVTQRIMKDPRTMGNLMKDQRFLKILQSIKNRKASDAVARPSRQGYRYGSPPVRTNQAGITELDYRQKGGFVPPIGVKEKADDIPAMLSNNEFVFTANAVRNAGGGSVKEGAKKMYGLMRQLEGRS